MRKRIPGPIKALSDAVAELPGDLKSPQGSAKTSARLAAMGSPANAVVAAAAGDETLALLSLGTRSHRRRVRRRRRPTPRAQLGGKGREEGKAHGKERVKGTIEKTLIPIAPAACIYPPLSSCSSGVFFYGNYLKNFSYQKKPVPTQGVSTGIQATRAITSRSARSAMRSMPGNSGAGIRFLRERESGSPGAG